MITFLPPISRWQCLNAGGAGFRDLPAHFVEPVKDTMPTSLWRISGAPTSLPPPVTMFTTPLGRPASSSAFSRFTTERGVSVAGLITTVLPRMRAGVIFQEGMAMGSSRE
jgi:hypothetical protein